MSEEKLAKLREYLRLPQALGRLMSISHWDEHVDGGSPRAATQQRANAVGLVSGEYFRLMTAPELLELVDSLAPRVSEMEDRDAAMVRRLKRELDKARKIPPEENQAYQIMLREAEAVWQQAKQENRFDLIAPFYEKIFAFKRKTAQWYGYGKHPYDALLDDYEEGATTEMYDRFFTALREKIVPLIKLTHKRKPRADFLGWSYDVARQAELGKKLVQEIGFDLSRGLIGETEHPFCAGIFPNDVRITTHYYENMLFSALFSTLHEGGHGIYEQGYHPDLYDYMLADGASMSVHESQSRFYENMIGRSMAYIRHIEPELKERFPALTEITAQELYEAVNKAEPSLIRIEADELTYCLHIMVRYELEKLILEDKLDIRDLPARWNALYEEYLGVIPPDDARGVLQDVHWSCGYVGYFPTYALGSAYAAQLMHALRKDMDVNSLVETGDFGPIKNWLGERVHRYGMLKAPAELIKAAVGEPFNPAYYIDYLTEKFTRIYG